MRATIRVEAHACSVALFRCPSNEDSLGRFPSTQLFQNLSNMLPGGKNVGIGVHEKAPGSGAFIDGRYWARTSDPQLVDPPASFPPRFVRFVLFRKMPLFSEVSAAFEPVDVKRWQTTYREFRHCIRFETRKRLFG
jgi:hypothetical protein